MTERKPGIRVDGSKRRDLNKERVASRMAGVLKAIRSEEEIAKSSAARRRDGIKERRSAKKLARQDGGKDGTRAVNVKVKISGMRAERKTMRCRPGTFEWRYGRDKQDALFHAGSHLAILWERAGMTVASSANFLRGIASGYAAGISEARVNAIDALEGFRKTMGQKPAERLIDYCVAGLTSAEIAAKNGTKERDMAPVLHQHLRDCAVHFHFLGKRR